VTLKKHLEQREKGQPNNLEKFGNKVTCQEQRIGVPINSFQAKTNFKASLKLNTFLQIRKTPHTKEEQVNNENGKIDKQKNP
jgi:hypothetical protein